MTCLILANKDTLKIAGVKLLVDTDLVREVRGSMWLGGFGMNIYEYLILFT